MNAYVILDISVILRVVSISMSVELVKPMVSMIALNLERVQSDAFWLVILGHSKIKRRTCAGDFPNSGIYIRISFCT